MLKGKYIRYKITCELCLKTVSSIFIDRHKNSKSCNTSHQFTSLVCEYCGLSCKNKSGVTNHSKVCYKNPNKIDDPRKGLPGRLLTEQQKEHLRHLYKTNKPDGFGGYQKNAGTGRRYSVLDSFGKEVILQSSYEKLMQELLDKNNVIWIRPHYLKYDNKKYYPDFYLIEYDTYIDTKNNYLALVDKIKLDKVREQNDVNLLLVLKEEISHSLFERLPPPVAQGEQVGL